MNSFWVASAGLVLALGACVAPPARFTVDDTTPDRFAATGNFAGCLAAASALADHYQSFDAPRAANARYDAASCAEAMGDRRTALLNYRLSQEADPDFYLARTAELRAQAPLKTAETVMAQARAHVTKRLQDQLDAATHLAFASNPVDDSNPPEAVAETPPAGPQARPAAPPRRARAPAEIVVAGARLPLSGVSCLKVDGAQIHNSCDQPLLARYCSVSSCVDAKDREAPDQPTSGQHTLLLPPGVTRATGPVAWMVACRLSEVLRDGVCHHAVAVN